MNQIKTISKQFPSFFNSQSGIQNIRIFTSLIAIVFINFIFLIKYTQRFTQYSLLLSIIITFVFVLLYFSRHKIPYNDKQNNLLTFSIVTGYIILSIALFLIIPQSVLNVDRFSVITSFWDSFFNSEYVYFSKSVEGNMPGPMPFYFILAFPFYLTGELGYFSMLGLLTFVIILKYSKVASKNLFIGTLLVVLSAFYIWETISRSNIFLNSNLVLFAILFFGNTLKMKKNKHILFNGILIGLLLSTRNVLIIPFIVLFLYALKVKIYSFTDTAKIAVVVLIAFGFTFLPFVVNHFKDFKVMNPFIIQSTYLMPTWLSLTCVLFTVTTVFFTKCFRDVVYFSGLYLFITILVYFLHQIFIEGFENVIFQNKADISYFILCVPFFIFYLLSVDNQISERPEN